MKIVIELDDEVYKRFMDDYVGCPDIIYAVRKGIPLPQSYSESEYVEGMSEQMEFPESFEKFAKEYGFKDDKEVYTNGLDLIPIFRVKQWLEHDNKLRTIETDATYECGKHANKWIPVSERLPKIVEWYLTSIKWADGTERVTISWFDGVSFKAEVKAWMPLPQPYKEEGSDKE